MEDKIKKFPRQLTEGYKLADTAGLEYKDAKIKNIILAGMGGSGLVGNVTEVLSEVLDINIPVITHKNYNLPREASSNSLIVTISYSGNTEETLSAYTEATKLGAHLVVITTGGKLAKMAKDDKNPGVIVPDGVQPRMAIGYQLSALLGVLSNAGIINSQKEKLENLSKNLNTGKYRDKAKILADQIHGTVPVIYSSEKLGKIAYILKILINETAKQHAFSNIFPEMNHNELEGFENENRNNISVVMLKDLNDHKKIKKRMDVASKLIKERGYPVYTIDTDDKDWYNKSFSLILFGNWLAYYLSSKNNVESEAVDLIEEFKGLL
ncbi:MAG: bifunctional phosphoglucose/phosphomannose isomerase [Candidatus Spechtbacterales bacterium]|nr:bifunctional phosphoglucose/phosphomannose isomerase [Candidatus Spechtbacterales bacterium]